MAISLVMTVLNEEASLPSLLNSILVQERFPDEVVIVDGGSSDRTVLLAGHFAQLAKSKNLPVRIEIYPGANISAGRNRAIELATGDIIVVTDGGVVLHSEWLGLLAGALEDGCPPLADVAAGFFMPESKSHFEMAMGATVLPAIEDIKPNAFLPSSRSVAFRRSAWEQVGRYPEWLDYCEDVVFDLALRRAGLRQRFVPNALVWFRPRPSLQAFFGQYYRYARGDGKAGLWRLRHTIRYAVYLLSPLFLIMSTFWPAFAWLILLAIMAYVQGPYRRLWKLSEYIPGTFLRAGIWVPAIRLVGDVAKMIGYPVGMRWRWKQGGRWQ